tara:strand:- start:54 stop:290 length:237 start_codon:yes stop_codon:yes gene_type:complete
MKPVNSKSLLGFVFEQMEKLDKGEIDNAKAREQSNLIKQANNLLKYELDRSKVKIQLAEHNTIYKDNIELRDIESKNF